MRASLHRSPAFNVVESSRTVAFNTGRHLRHLRRDIQRVRLHLCTDGMYEMLIPFRARRVTHLGDPLGLTPGFWACCCVLDLQVVNAQHADDTAATRATILHRKLEGATTVLRNPVAPRNLVLAAEGELSSDMLVLQKLEIAYSKLSPRCGRPRDTFRRERKDASAQ